MKILLVGNYIPDHQESMQRFAELLKKEFQERGHTVYLLRPSVRTNTPQFQTTGLSKWLGYIDKFLIFPSRLRRAARRADITHICDHSNASYVHAVKRLPHIVTCHDVLAIRSALGRVPQNPTGRTGRILQNLILRGLKRAQYIVCDSQSTQNELLELSQLEKSRTEVVYIGLNYPYSPMPAAEAKSRLAPLLKGHDSILQDGYLVHLGANVWYKNRLGVLDIYRRTRDALQSNQISPPQLVMVGPPFTKEMNDFIRSQGLIDAVIEVVNCSNEDLRALYSEARALLFPSLAEGFGWPVLEAQACGCPVFAADRSSIPEVGGTAACYFDPDHPQDAAQKLARFLQDEPESLAAAKMKDEGLANVLRFSVASMTENYLSAYERALQSQN